MITPLLRVSIRVFIPCGRPQLDPHPARGPQTCHDLVRDRARSAEQVDPQFQTFKGNLVSPHAEESLFDLVRLGPT
jgi:hypothetical protein